MSIAFLLGIAVGCVIGFLGGAAFCASAVLSAYAAPKGGRDG